MIIDFSAGTTEKTQVQYSGLQPLYFFPSSEGVSFPANPIHIYDILYDIHVKQPSERQYIGITFATRIADADALSSVLAYTCHDSAGIDVTSTIIEAPVIDGTNVNMWVKAGIDCGVYEIKIKTKTVNSSICEGDLRMYVREEGHA